MPSVTQEHGAVVPSKKRRRDDADAAADIHLQLCGRACRGPPLLDGDAAAGGPHQQNVVVTLKHGGDRALYHAEPAAADDGLNAAAFLVNRRILPLAKRIRVDDDRPDEHRDRPRTGSPGSRQHRTDGLALQHTTANAGRPQQHHHQQQQQQQHHHPGGRTAPAVLSPCHICHRRPTKKSDLDSFADCQGCGKRSCFVCIRQCLGWRPGDHGRDAGGMLLGDLPSSAMEDVGGENDGARPRGGPGQRTGKDAWAAGGSGHRQMVCSRCCVERGADGDVVCLGCLPFIEG